MHLLNISLNQDFSWILNVSIQIYQCLYICTLIFRNILTSKDNSFYIGNTTWIISVILHINSRFHCFLHILRVRIMVFNTTFNIISAISWRSVLLVEETRINRDHWPAASHWHTSSHNVVSSTLHHERDLNSQR